MQIKLFHKLLGAFIVASLASIVLFASIAHWTMGRSFLQYINDAREQRLETFASSLSQWYLNEGGWDRIRDDRRAWHQLMFDIARQQRADHAELAGRRRAVMTNATRRRPTGGTRARPCTMPTRTSLRDGCRIPTQLHRSPS